MSLLFEWIDSTSSVLMKFCWMPTNDWHRQSFRKTYHIWPNELTIMHFYPTHETGDTLGHKNRFVNLAFQVRQLHASISSCTCYWDASHNALYHNQQIIKAAITDEVSWCKIQFVVWHRPPWIKHVPNQVHQVPEIAPHLTKSCKKMISLRSQNIQGRGFSESW